MEKEVNFPAGLKPSDLATAEADTTRLVWDLTRAEEKEKGYVKVYLRAEDAASKSEEKKEVAANPPKPQEAAAAAVTTEEPTNATSTNSGEVIEASVLQYQRQLRKTQAAKKAGAVLSDDQLEVIFEDESIVVVNKPAGVLCVPGINNNDSVANLVFVRLQKHSEQGADLCQDACSMAVHRLDMDTSGLVVFGKTKSAVSTLHQVFRRETPQENKKKKRNKKRKKRPKPGEQLEDGPANNAVEEETHTEETISHPVVKEYEALVCGHLPLDIESGFIDLPLQRDVHHPPFMRVSTPYSETLARQVVDALRERNWTKLSKRNPKQSQTTFRVMGREYYAGTSETGKDDSSSSPNEIPVTRLSLTPITGRTHQLRVHCAAMGFPIVGDPVYGIYGESAFCGGLADNGVEIVTAADAKVVDSKTWRAPISLQKQIMEKHPPGEKDMCLHAKKLGFSHPVTKTMGEWNVAPKF